MLVNTRATFNKIFMDFKRFSYSVSIAMNCIYVIAMIYALATGTGNVYVNITLLVGAVAYFAFYLVTYWDKEKNKDRRRAKKTYRWFKIAMNGVSLAVTVYGLYVATEHITLLSVLIAAASAISWIFQITTALVIAFIESRKNLIVSALAMDFAFVSKSANAVGNVVRKIKGEERVEASTVSEEMEKRIEKIKDVFLKKKAEKAAAKSAEKEAERSEKG